MFDTIDAARPALRKLRRTRALFIRHLCQEDRVVLVVDGFGIQPWGDGWLIWRRAT